MVPHLLLLPCAAQKRLPTVIRMDESENHGLTLEALAEHWKERLRRGAPQVAVRNLYKGAGWKIAIGIEEVARQHQDRVLVVSGGIGLAGMSDTAPGYDLSLSCGRDAAAAAPGCGVPVGRASWWKMLGGSAALRAHVATGAWSAVVAALPSAYVDAVAEAFEDLAIHFPNVSLAILTTRPSRFARNKLHRSLVEVDPRRTRCLGGTVSCAPQLALRHAILNLPTGESLTPESIREVVSKLPSVEAVYPRRTSAGRQHAEMWLRRALLSTQPPTSATRALRSYRMAGFAHEQRAFHRMFAELSSDACAAITAEPE